MIKSTVRGALAGSSTGLLATLATLRVHDIRTADDDTVCVCGLALGLGAGVALGVASERPGRLARFLAGSLAAPLGFGLLALWLLVATGKLPWEESFAPSVFLLLRGPLGLARMLAVAALALAGGELALPPSGDKASSRARRALACGTIAVLLGGISVALGQDVSTLVWLHTVALVPLAVAASFVAAFLVPERRDT